MNSNFWIRLDKMKQWMVQLYPVVWGLIGRVVFEVKIDQIKRYYMQFSRFGMLSKLVTETASGKYPQFRKSKQENVLILSLTACPGRQRVLCSRESWTWRSSRYRRHWSRWRHESSPRRSASTSDLNKMGSLRFIHIEFDV